MFVTKSEAISILKGLKSEENINKVMAYIDRINYMSDKEWQEFVINNQLTAEKFAEEANRRIIHTQEFISLNDLISYGITGETLHIHVVPKDAHGLLNRRGLIYAEQKLIDALEIIRTMIEKEEQLKHINKVFAVSDILHGPVKKMFEQLGFSTKIMKIEEAKVDPELSNFYYMFKYGRRLGRAKISKEKLESDEWKQLAEARKKELQNKIEEMEKSDTDKDY